MRSAERTAVFSEAKAREKQADDRKQNAKRLTNALRLVMASPEGRRAVRWILDTSGVDLSVSTSDPHMMAIASGRRDVGLEVLKRLKTICPESVYLMEKERTDE